MAKEIEIPDIASSIPDDADDATKLYMRAQGVIQATFYAFGDHEISPGETTMTTSALEEVLAAALAMLVASDTRLETKRDVRRALEHHEKYMRRFAGMLKDAQDTNAMDILEMLRIRRSSPN